MYIPSLVVSSGPQRVETLRARQPFFSLTSQVSMKAILLPHLFSKYTYIDIDIREPQLHTFRHVRHTSWMVVTPRPMPCLAVHESDVLEWVDARAIAMSVDMPRSSCPSGPGVERRRSGSYMCVCVWDETLIVSIYNQVSSTCAWVLCIYTCSMLPLTPFDPLPHRGVAVQFRPMRIKMLQRICRESDIHMLPTLRSPVEPPNPSLPSDSRDRPRCMPARWIVNRKEVVGLAKMGG